MLSGDVLKREVHGRKNNSTGNSYRCKQAKETSATNRTKHNRIRIRLPRICEKQRSPAIAAQESNIFLSIYSQIFLHAEDITRLFNYLFLITFAGTPAAIE